MGVRQDGDGNYVTNARPHLQYDTESQARIADAKEKYQSELANSALNSSHHEGDQVIGQAIGYLIVACLAWAIVFGLILIPGLNSAGMLIYNGGILGIVGQIIWIIFKAAFTLLTVPMMVAGIVSPYDPGTHYISQAVVMAVVSGIIFKFRKNVKKPIVSTLGFLAICTCVSIGLVATNADLWSQFQMFPNL